MIKIVPRNVKNDKTLIITDIKILLFNHFIIDNKIFIIIFLSEILIDYKNYLFYKHLLKKSIAI